MTTLPNHLPLPLAGFVRRLRAAGFAVDAGREFQLRRVLHEQGAEYIGRFEELKYALAPYVVTNAGEQRRFYRLWDDYVVSLEQQLVVDPEDAPITGWRKWAKQLRYLLMGLVMLLLALLARDLIQEGPAAGPTPVRVELLQEAEARAGQALQVHNATLLEEARDSVDFIWDIRDAETGRSIYRQDSFDLHYTVPDTMTGYSLRIVLWAQHLESETKLGVDTMTLTVLCADAPPVPPITSLPSKVFKGESWEVPKIGGRTWRIDRGETLEFKVRLRINGEILEATPEEYVFSEEGQTKVQLLVHRVEDPDNCFALSPPRTVQVGSNIPVFPSIPLKKDIPRQILEAGSWLYLLLLLFGLWVYWLHRRKWLKKEDDTREKTDDELAEEYPFHDVGPYVIPYQDQSGQISVPADFYRIADQLRVREAGLRMAFDGKATVEATVREGGFPSWRERAVKRPANYLVLLRHTDEFQQQDRLLKRLTDFLITREAELDVYYHGGDFSWFWNEAHPKGWSPAQMNGRYGEHRLIILGDGHGLVDAFHRREPRLEPTKERWLMKWTRRLLLTTEPAVDWSFQEVLLHKDLLLYPATTNGILRGVADLNQVEEYQGSSYTRWKAERFRRNPEPSHRYRTWTTVDEHRDYLANDPELFRWLTALSVAPNPNWSLTIAIGRALGLNITHDRLLQLSRIPWLAVNSPDQTLRLAFLAELPFADEQLARAAALEQLDAVSGEVENTFAESEWTANQAVQTFALAPLENKNQSKIRDLRRIGMLTPDQLAELNQVAERQLPQTKKGSSVLDESSSLDELLNPPVKKGEVLNDREKELLGLIVACFLMFLPMYLYNKAGHELLPGDSKAFWQELENPTDDAHRALEKNNTAVAMSNLLDRVDGYMSNTENKSVLENRIESSLDSALLLMGQKYPLVDSNLVAFQLNRLAYTLNWVAADSALLGPMLNEDINELLSEADAVISDKFSTDTYYELQRLHAEGIFKWLTFRSIEITAEDKSGAVNPWIDALRIKARIDSIDQAFFDNLVDSMPVNLAYLLANDPRPTFDFDGKVISGKVIDQKGAPLIGALVHLGGTNKGTVTDFNGAFSLGLTRGKGYLEVAWQDATPIEVSLLTPMGDAKPETRLEDIVLNVPDGTEQSKQIRGRVIGPDGKGLRNVVVTETRQGREVITGPNGTYVLTLDGAPDRVTLVFEIDGLRRERNFRLGLEQTENLGEILLAERQTPTQAPEPVNNILTGQIVDGSGAPLIGASVLLVGTSVVTTTDTDGNFSIRWNDSADGLTVSLTGYASKSILVNRGGGLLQNDLGRIVLNPPQIQEPVTDEEIEINSLLDGSEKGMFKKSVLFQQPPAKANDFINAVTAGLKENRSRRNYSTGEELINYLKNAFRTDLKTENTAGNAAQGKFLFIGETIRIPFMRLRINKVRNNSEALIFTTSRLQEDAFRNYPDLSGSSANLTTELRKYGFKVRTILDPTLAEMKSALNGASTGKSDDVGARFPTQFLLMFNTYKIGDDVMASDSEYGDPATYLSSKEVETYQNRITSNIPHVLVLNNYMDTGSLPNDVGLPNAPEQTTSGQRVSLASSDVSGGELGIGISYRPTLEVAVTTPGTMVFSVCIDSYGRVTNAKFDQEKSGQFEYDQVQEVGKNASQWRFNVSPKGQPDQQCGEVSFEFK